MEGLTVSNWAMNSFCLSGDMYMGMELFKTFLSENLIASRFTTEVAGADNIDLQGITDSILSIGNSVGLKN